jgi:hypothetical protein
MIIGNRETFIGLKVTSIISENPFYHYIPQENFREKTYKEFSFEFIQTGQDP